MKRDLTQPEVKEIQAALQAARKGQATLGQLSRAHDLAADAYLNGTIGELRAHIHAITPQPPMRVEAKSILLGVMSGVLTHLIFRWYEKPMMRIVGGRRP